MMLLHACVWIQRLWRPQRALLREPRKEDGDGARVGHGVAVGSPVKVQRVAHHAKATRVERAEVREGVRHDALKRVKGPKNALVDRYERPDGAVERAEEKRVPRRQVCRS